MAGECWIHVVHVVLFVEAFAPLDAACARGLRRRMGVAVSHFGALYMTYVSFVRLHSVDALAHGVHACRMHAWRFFSIDDVKVPLFFDGVPMRSPAQD